MTKKINFWFLSFMVSTTMLLTVTTNIYSQDWLCERNCKAFEHDGKCICYEFNPSLPYEEVEKEEYNNKKSAASAVLYGLNGNIWLDGKKFEWNSVDFSKENKFDFALLHGYFWTGDDENIEKFIRKSSFYASTLRYSQFSNTFFIDCDFRYANLIGTDFSGISDSCKFYGAKIKGAKLFLSQEQLLTTDPFIEKISGTNNIKKQIYLEKVSLKSNGYQPPIFTYPEDLKKLNVPIEYDKLPRDEQSHLLDKIDFNKFNNNSLAELPYVIRECQFFRSFIDCNFARGTIENSRFESDLFLNRKVEKCDFSNA
ncbi:MAG: pentapeptide repeat-containing protein, partial [Planctomycetaceae bacterium]|nr:pentapeptide repeat-containing protein [Planctomycetaceae bacterium]